jgi:hypothetical protein
MEDVEMSSFNFIPYEKETDSLQRTKKSVSIEFAKG